MSRRIDRKKAKCGHEAMNEQEDWPQKSEMRPKDVEGVGGLAAKKRNAAKRR